MDGTRHVTTSLAIPVEAHAEDLCSPLSRLAGFTVCFLFRDQRKKTARLNRAFDAPTAYRRLSMVLYSNAQAPQFRRCLPTCKMARCQRIREREKGPLCCAGLGAFHDSLPREGCPST